LLGKSTAAGTAACWREVSADRIPRPARSGIPARTVLTWVHTFAPLLAAAAHRHSNPLGRRWWCDETYTTVRGRQAYLYREIDEDGQVVDVLLRAHRDLDSARAFFAQAIGRRGVTPEEVITDGHPAYRRATKENALEAVHIVTGLHRAPGHPTPQPIERAHVPVKDRLRPMRGLHSIVTGQRLVEGMTLARAIRRGDAAMGGSGPPPTASLHQRARQVVATFQELAGELTRLVPGQPGGGLSGTGSAQCNFTISVWRVELPTIAPPRAGLPISRSPHSNFTVSSC
jgi:transposase-like protein